MATQSVDCEIKTCHTGLQIFFEISADKTVVAAATAAVVVTAVEFIGDKYEIHIHTAQNFGQFYHS